MKMRFFLLAGAFLAFTAYTAVIVVNHGYTGWIDLAMTGGWGGQLFVDLCVALLLFAVWMVGDARTRAIPALPYVIAIVATGSVGALAYLMHRTLHDDRAQARQPAHPAQAR